MQPTLHNRLFGIKGHISLSAPARKQARLEMKCSWSRWALFWQIDSSVCARTCSCLCGDARHYSPNISTDTSQNGLYECRLSKWTTQAKRIDAEERRKKKEKWRFSCQTQHFAGSLFKVGRAQDAINLSVCLDVLYHLLSGLYLSFFHSHLMKRHLAWKWAEAPLQPRQIKREIKVFNCASIFLGKDKRPCW